MHGRHVWQADRGTEWGSANIHKRPVDPLDQIEAWLLGDLSHDCKASMYCHGHCVVPIDRVGPQEHGGWG